MTTAYPLHWPAGLPRTKTKLQSRFQSTLHRALENVRAELRLFGKDSGKPVSDLILSSNVTLTEQRPADTGIAAYFKWDGLDCCIAVDRYPKVEHNVQAIAKVVEAERAKLRHGGLNVVRAAFRGYAALPPPRDGKPWWDVLGVPQDCQSRRRPTGAPHARGQAPSRRRRRRRPDGRSEPCLGRGAAGARRLMAGSIRPLIWHRMRRHVRGLPGQAVVAAGLSVDPERF